MTVENVAVQFAISARLMRRLYAGLLVVNVLLIALYLLLRSYSDLPWILQIIRNQIDLTKENVAAVWYSGAILMFVSITAYLCLMLDTQRTPRERLQVCLRYGWVGIAAAFAFFSLDELGSLHERLDKIFPAAFFIHTGGETGWVTVLWPIIGAVFFYFFAFFWYYLAKYKPSQILAFIGGSLLISVPLQERLEHVIYARGEGRGLYLPALEEGSELFGATLILIAFVEFAIHVGGVSGGSLNAIHISFARRTIRSFYAILLALCVISYLVACFFVPQLDDVGSRGDPSTWYPSMALLMVGIIAFVNSSLIRFRHSDTGFSRWAWVMVGTSALVLSVNSLTGLSDLILGKLAITSYGVFNRYAITNSIPAAAVILVCCTVFFRCCRNGASQTSRFMFVIAAALWAGMFVVESILLREAFRVLVPTLLLASFLEVLKIYVRESFTAAVSEPIYHRAELQAGM